MGRLTNNTKLGTSALNPCVVALWRGKLKIGNSSFSFKDSPILRGQIAFCLPKTLLFAIILCILLEKSQFLLAFEEAVSSGTRHKMRRFSRVTIRLEFRIKLLSNYFCFLFISRNGDLIKFQTSAYFSQRGKNYLQRKVIKTFLSFQFATV